MCSMYVFVHWIFAALAFDIFNFRAGIFMLICTPHKTIVHTIRAVGCSHQRAWEYFIESIQRPKGFLASHCEPKSSVLPTKNHTEINCDKNISAYMGYNADTR